LPFLYSFAILIKHAEAIMFFKIYTNFRVESTIEN
jgi:hypothetical protein